MKWISNYKVAAATHPGEGVCLLTFKFPLDLSGVVEYPSWAVVIPECPVCCQCLVRPVELCASCPPLWGYYSFLPTPCYHIVAFIVSVSSVWHAFHIILLLLSLFHVDLCSGVMLESIFCPFPATPRPRLMCHCCLFKYLVQYPPLAPFLASL